MDRSTRSLLLGLTQPTGRAAAARALAEFVGATELIVFALDREVNVLLPAPGFPQTMPDAQSWRAFLVACSATKQAHVGQLGNQSAMGFSGEDGTVMVLLGGDPWPKACDQIAPWLPFVGAVFQVERQALAGKAHTMVARGAAQKAEELTASLARTQTVLNGALSELHEKQQWLAATLKSIGDGVIVTDAEGRVVFLNAVAGAISGWSDGEARGKPLSAVFRIRHQDSGEQVESPVDQALSTGQITSLPELTLLVRKDGSQVAIDDSAAPIRNEAGRLTGAVLVFRDITERLRAEAEKEKLRARERTAHEFEQQLIGIVSHDLRSPLAAVLMSATVLQRTLSDPQALKVVRRIVSSGERAERLIRDLLDFTQARLGGGISVNPAPMDLHDVVKQVVEEARLGNPERKIEVTHEGSGRGTWDADRIAQVISNLLSNALRYSPPEGTVQIRSRAEKDQVVLEVHNGGAPIPTQLVPELFKPMKRGDDQTDHLARSIGLGLYIVHSILAAHHADVSVQSSAEAGTTFTVRLPL